ncbi:hypothetical protein PR202_gb15131 [Eleusine coracana subsp. coracana]|uniref:Uncharacterized protein n=1 Tax=Eleusine coracana subsp. coracana TaxID=191504 RepID=A0AAV5EX30_ELECO|nr:hypothetical protein PR202_gb15131 [Eleusine coracana subsp. coracana]
MVGDGGGRAGRRGRRWCGAAQRRCGEARRRRGGGASARRVEEEASAAPAPAPPRNPPGPATSGLIATRRARLDEEDAWGGDLAAHRRPEPTPPSIAQHVPGPLRASCLRLAAAHRPAAIRLLPARVIDLGGRDGRGRRESARSTGSRGREAACPAGGGGREGRRCRAQEREKRKGGEERKKEREKK